MRGLGTIINALAIVIGGVLGILFKRFLKERYQDTIIKATGFSVVFLGAAGTLSKILTVRPDGTLSTGGSMVMILSLALGALLGELIDLDAQFERFGEWLKHKTGSDGDFRESENLMDDVKNVVRHEIKKCEEKGIRDWSTIKSTTRENLRDYIFAKTKRNPMIIPIIMEV